MRKNRDSSLVVFSIRVLSGTQGEVQEPHWTFGLVEKDSEKERCASVQCILCCASGTGMADPIFQDKNNCAVHWGSYLGTNEMAVTDNSAKKTSENHWRSEQREPSGLFPRRDKAVLWHPPAAIALLDGEFTNRNSRMTICADSRTGEEWRSYRRPKLRENTPTRLLSKGGFSNEHLDWRGSQRVKTQMVKSCCFS